MNRLVQGAAVIGLVLAAQGQGPARPEVPESLKAPAGEEVILAAHATGTQVYLPAGLGSKVRLGVQSSGSGADGRDGEENCSSFRGSELEAHRRKRSDRQSDRQARRGKAGRDSVAAAGGGKSHGRWNLQSRDEHSADQYRGWPATGYEHLRCVCERQRVEERLRG